jgi:ubiquinone/menaquinone biosynthesis C-methylase UbiE
MNYRDRLIKEYSREDIVRKYSNLSSPSPLTILEEFVCKRHLIISDALILDIACGAGRETIGLMHMGFNKIVGIDASLEMLKKAKENIRNKGLKMPAVRADSLNIPFKNGYFDFILIIGVTFPLLGNKNNRIAILKEVRRVMKDNGSLFFDLVRRGIPSGMLSGYLGPGWLGKGIAFFFYLAIQIINSIVNIKRYAMMLLLGKKYKGLEPWDMTNVSSEDVILHLYSEREIGKELRIAGFTTIESFTQRSVLGKENIKGLIKNLVKSKEVILLLARK